MALGAVTRGCNYLELTAGAGLVSTDSVSGKVEPLAVPVVCRCQRIHRRAAPPKAHDPRRRQRSMIERRLEPLRMIDEFVLENNCTASAREFDRAIRGITVDNDDLPRDGHYRIDGPLNVDFLIVGKYYNSKISHLLHSR